MLNFPQPAAYLENLSVTAVAKQLSAVFPRCSGRLQDVWTQMLPLCSPRFPFSLGRELWEGQVAFFPSWRYLPKCFPKALCPLNPLIILLRRGAWLSLQHVLGHLAWYCECECERELEIQVLHLITSKSIPVLVFFLLWKKKRIFCRS